jgi:MFS-type transporter involved in bile tolerance (Atg22 family)
MSLVALLTNNVRFSVLAVIPLFIIGGLLLIKVKTPDTRIKPSVKTEE